MSYYLIGWENKPSVKTPLGKSNLNHMDKGIFDAHEELKGKSPAIINTESGETILTTDSANVPLVSMKTFGKSWQNTVPGNQLFEKVNSEGLGGTVSADGLTVTSNVKDGNGYVDLFSIYCPSILFVAGTTYYFSAKMKLVQGTLNQLNTISLFDANNNQVGGKVEVSMPKISRQYQRYVFSFTPTSDIDVVRVYVQGHIAVNAVVEITDIMVSTVNAEWEPYVGGIPSPNPNYPQDIHSHGDSGSIEYGVYGGNLFNASAIPLSSATVENDIITINADTTDFYLSGAYGGGTSLIDLLKGTYALSSSNSNVRITLYYKQNGNVMAIDSALDNSIITLLETISIHGIRIRSVDGKTLKGTSFGIMLNVGSDKLSFEPYTEQPFTLQTPNGLGGIEMGSNIFTIIKNSSIHMQGVYLDSATNHYCIGNLLDLDRGKNIQFIGEYIFTGDETFNKRGINIADVYQVYLKQFKFGDSAINVPTLCTHYRYSTDNALNTCYIMANGYVSFGFAEYGTTTATDIKAKFKELYDAGTPVKLYGVLATPIETDLTIEEIEHYKALMMNYPNTTIINDANAYTEVEYVSDTKCYIDNKFKELEIALANTNAQLL